MYEYVLTNIVNRKFIEHLDESAFLLATQPYK